ncbi:MAG TPA: aminoglycoside phosphotransferase family protein, partial [Candidatus Limnocylindrales bacterium]|nr:aminoglycoside phosphotransferase family protein [Candidatus Limnocylindrales bacterium]
TGGRSHANHLLVIEDRQGRRRRRVLRRWARVGWADEDPDFDAAREAAVLGRLERAGVPAPRLVAADLFGTATDVPALLETVVPGRTVRRPRNMATFIDGLVSAIALVHGVPPDPVSDRAIAYRRFYDPATMVPPAWARSRDAWNRAIEFARRPVSASAMGFIHRDYHPGNVLWRGGDVRRGVSGIVDWTSASFGPFAVDVGHMRFNLAASLGQEAADHFREAAARRGIAPGYSPEWDVRATLDVMPDISGQHETGAELDRIEAHLARALAQLAARDIR